MGYREGEGLGKSGRIAEDKKQGRGLKDEMFTVQNSESQPKSAYSDFAQRQMVRWYFFIRHVTRFINLTLLKINIKVGLMDSSHFCYKKCMSRSVKIW